MAGDDVTVISVFGLVHIHDMTVLWSRVPCDSGGFYVNREGHKLLTPGTRLTIKSSWDGSECTQVKLKAGRGQI